LKPIKPFGRLILWFITVIPIMDKIASAEGWLISAKSITYADMQNDMRDTEWALLNCPHDSIFALARRSDHLPFSGQIGHTCLAPQTSPLHL
jgi:hypothetical protein